MTLRPRTVALTLGASLIALGFAFDPAAAQNNQPQGQNRAQPKAGDPTAGQRNDTASATFVKQAAVSDMFEIETSKLAVQKSQNNGVRQFAQKMIDEHTKMSQQVKSAAMQDQVAAGAPSQLDRPKTQQLDDLKKLNGAAFDKKYVEIQVKAHQEAAKLFETYAKSGEDANLKKTVNEGLPHIKHHLQEAQALQRSVQTAEVPAGSRPAEQRR
jgi:putative membrane protein